MDFKIKFIIDVVYKLVLKLGFLRDCVLVEIIIFFFIFGKLFKVKWYSLFGCVFLICCNFFSLVKFRILSNFGIFRFLYKVKILILFLKDIFYLYIVLYVLYFY